MEKSRIYHKGRETQSLIKEIKMRQKDLETSQQRIENLKNQLRFERKEETRLRERLNNVAHWLPNNIRKQLDV